MSERVIKIEPFKTYDDIIRLTGKVNIPEANLDIPISENRNLNICLFTESLDTTRF